MWTPGFFPRRTCRAFTEPGSNGTAARRMLVRDQLPGVGVAAGTLGVIAGSAGVAAGSCGAAMGEGEVAGMAAGDAAGEGVVFAVLVVLGFLPWCRCAA